MDLLESESHVRFEFLFHMSLRSSLSALLDVQRPKKAHIKKPLNAFMLYMREQRAQVIEASALKESSAINKVLGQKWKELPRAEQDRYYGQFLLRLGRLSLVRFLFSRASERRTQSSYAIVSRLVSPR